MAVAMLSWLLAVPLLGVATGLRAMTPMAALCWFAYLGYLPVDDTWAAWTARTAAVVTFTVLAVAECVADKLPLALNRISLGPLLVRLVFGGLGGSVAATAMDGPGVEGVLLGVLGTLLGAYGGFMVRRDLCEKISCSIWRIAAVEDIISLLCAIFALHVVTS